MARPALYCALKGDLPADLRDSHRRQPDHDKAFDAVEGELDPVKRAALFIKMTDMVVGDSAVIPVVYRPGVSAMSRQLRATLSGWDKVLWDLKNWYRET
jgi:peptide/nickel transport system substrate-binding protein